MHRRCCNQIDSQWFCLTLRSEGKSIARLKAGLKLHPIQQHLSTGGFSAFGRATKALLDDNPSPSEDEIKDWMMGNLCRCTGYYKIIESIQAAAAQMSGAAHAPGKETT